MKIFTAFALLIVSVGSAHAGVIAVPAPEIDAISGLAALGSLSAIAAVIWERSRC
jgi:hypothetical protein